MNTEKKSLQPRPNNKIEKLLTIQEVSELLGVKINWIRSSVRHKSIPFVKIGRHVRFRQDDLQEFIERNTKEAKM